jgi:GNAT superfamily N-acetyltransferase
MTTHGVLRLYESDVTRVVDVICDAFADYPVMRFMLGREGDYQDRLRRLVRFFVMARIHRDEFILGIEDDGTLQGAALVSLPSRTIPSPPLDLLRDELWTELGADARARYDSYAATSGQFMPPEYHYHLNVLAVRHAAHGKGYSRPLLEHVHALSAGDPHSSGVSLTTETAKNVPLYEHFGYRIVGQAEFAPGMMCWGFFRSQSF